MSETGEERLDLSSAVEVLTDLLDDLDAEGFEDASLSGTVLVVEIRHQDSDGDVTRTTLTRTNTGRAHSLGLIETASEQARAEIRSTTEDD